MCFQPAADGKFTSFAYPKALAANPEPETKIMLSCSTKKSVHTENDQEGIVYKSDSGRGSVIVLYSIKLQRLYVSRIQTQIHVSIM